MTQYVIAQGVVEEAQAGEVQSERIVVENLVKEGEVVSKDDEGAHIEDSESIEVSTVVAESDVSEGLPAQDVEEEIQKEDNIQDEVENVVRENSGEVGVGGEETESYEKIEEKTVSDDISSDCAEQEVGGEEVKDVATPPESSVDDAVSVQKEIAERITPVEATVFTVQEASSEEGDSSEEDVCDDNVPFSQYKEAQYTHKNTSVQISVVTITDYDDLFIITNTATSSQDVTGWYIRKRTKGGDISTCGDNLFNTSTPVCEFGKTCGDITVLAPQQSVVFTRDKSRFINVADVVRSSVSMSDNNALILLDDDRVLRDSVVWGAGHDDDDFYRDIISNPTDDEYITHTKDGSMLKKQCAHDLLSIEPCAPLYAGQKVVINEVLPNPSGDEATQEYIELYNHGVETINLHGWVVGDATASGRYTFPYGTQIAPQGYLTILRATFNFALNNSNESVTLWAPGEKSLVSVDHVAYTRSAPEDVSLNHESDGVYRWSPHRTPGAQNIFNTLPALKDIDYDDKIYKNVRASFAVDAVDEDGDKLSYRWDFGDGHRSYLRETTHVYDEKGEYIVELRVQDASEEITRTFPINVTKYPHNHVVKVRAMAPNPDGKDTGSEYIIIKNTSDAKIDFGAWSIATGSSVDTLVNHPLRTDVTLKPGEEWEVRAPDAAISLPNKGGAIEIRRPDGSVAYDMTYSVPEGTKSVPVDAVYRKRAKGDGGGWVWDVSHVPTSKSAQKKSTTKSVDWTAVRALIARAWANEFGAQNTINNDVLAPAVRGAAVERAPEDVSSWHTRLVLWLNSTLAHVAQSVVTYAHTQVKNDNVLYIGIIDRSVLDGVSPHPAAVTLALTGLGSASVEEVLGLE